MFEVGQIVTYATSGACRITALEKRRVGEREMEYYILKPLYNPTMTICVPAANAALVARMRPALDREAVLRVIHAIPDSEPYHELEPELRKAHYIEALQSGDQTALARMLRSLYEVKRARQAMGKTLSSYEENAMREAENMLHSECAHALGILPGEVADFIGAELAGRHAASAPA